ncbi:TPA: hypothetical protein U1D15_001852 [Streptococcus suis]|nr:hypothetical protein [Streptococcus suis]
MPTEPNTFVDLIRVVAPVAGTFLTTIGGIAIAKIGSNNNKELTTMNNRLDVLQNTAEEIKEVRSELDTLKNSSRSSRRYTLFRDLEIAIGRGFTTLEERREIAKLFECYQVLGGNGEIQTMYDIFTHLPIKEVEL